MCVQMTVLPWCYLEARYSEGLSEERGSDYMNEVCCRVVRVKCETQIYKEELHNVLFWFRYCLHSHSQVHMWCH